MGITGAHDCCFFQVCAQTGHGDIAVSHGLFEAANVFGCNKFLLIIEDGFQRIGKIEIAHEQVGVGP
jgi:hypothetical protein